MNQVLGCIRDALIIAPIPPITAKIPGIYGRYAAPITGMNEYDRPLLTGKLTVRLKQS